MMALYLKSKGTFLLATKQSFKNIKKCLPTSINWIRQKYGELVKIIN